MSSDLQARVRLQQVTSALGLPFDSTPTGTSYPKVSEQGHLVILDLDQMGTAVTAWMEAAIEATAPPAEVLGFYSHVQEEVGAVARAAGVKVYPRGRFWRDLSSLLVQEGPEQNG